MADTVLPDDEPSTFCDLSEADVRAALAKGDPAVGKEVVRLARLYMDRVGAFVREHRRLPHSPYYEPRWPIEAVAFDLPVDTAATPKQRTPKQVAPKQKTPKRKQRACHPPLHSPEGTERQASVVGEASGKAIELALFSA